MTIDEHQHQAFGPGRTAAVIGAGISGVCAAAHLIRQGLKVTVFERSGIAGGVWHYDERIAVDPPYPNNTPSHGDYQVSRRGEFAYATPPPEQQSDGKGGIDIRGSQNVHDLEVQFSPPGPCYAGLKNNVPTDLMASILDPWPEGTEPIVSQQYLEQYIQMLARNHGVDAATRFHTRVDEVRKTPDGSKWEVRSVALQKNETGARLTEDFSHFDVLVVASGHYNMPRIPDIEGLNEWKERYPDRVTHSKRYRSPEKYRGKNFLILGAGVSSLDICRESDGIANKIYQSVRGGKYDIPASLLPANAERVPVVTKFALNDDANSTPHHLQDDQPVPGSVVLTDGQTLDNIHSVILATGYITSYPFLPHLHSDTSPLTSATDDVLVTSDGEMAHNLHRDIFYIPDPTLAFVGVPYHIATFSLFDFQAQAVARVFAGKARLPSREEMRSAYEKRVEEKGLGRGFHSLHAPGHEVAYVQELVDWVNGSAPDGDNEEPMQPHSEQWKERYEELKAKTRALFKRDEQEALAAAQEGTAQVLR